MKKNLFTNLFRFMLCAVVLSLPLACSDNEDAPEPTEQEIQAALNQKIFEDQIVGSCWEEYRLYCIDPITGERDKVDILHRGEPDEWNICGGGTDYWHFETDVLTTYMALDAFAADVFQKRHLTFDKEKNLVFVEGVVSVETGNPIPKFQIESVEGDTLRAVILIGTKRVGNEYYDQYAYGILKRASTEKLKYLQEFYNVDYDTLK